ncbi:ribonuclease H-like domain-containing protein [Infundibulicybe gibba]|nr:ribonuclease H-like domain-containing protein [Infundibulicybe gibba]
MLPFLFHIPPMPLVFNYNLQLSTSNWILGLTLVIVSCLVRWCYKGLMDRRLESAKGPTANPSQSPPSFQSSRGFSLGDIFIRIRRSQELLQATPETKPQPTMRYPNRTRATKKNLPTKLPPVFIPPKTKQPYDVFLVLDVEATCHLGTDFNFPNEIIEFPVCLMRWKDRTTDNRASQLEVVAEFRSFVKPSWRPTLSQFCTDLTGITQAQVDSAPSFPEVLNSFSQFLVDHQLIDAETGERRARFCWCSDGPFDVRDFVVKQCFISRIPMPGWIRGDVLDVRLTVMNWLSMQSDQAPQYPDVRYAQPWMAPRRRSLNIPSQLKALGLPTFEGRQHSGIDDTRNIAKIVTELARKGLCLQPNTVIHPGRRWQWMGKHGQILEDDCST